MESSKSQYQHFIPQFLLRNFSHKYVPPDKANAGKPKKRGNKKKMYPGDLVVNSLCLSDEYRIEECLVRRVCGLENMYVDTTKPAKEQGKLEKKFCVLENRASYVYRKITKAYEEGKSRIWLTRREEDILRKFIFLLAYRGEQYHRKYNVRSLQDYDEDDRDSLQAYMTKHGFTRPINVWLHGLETIIDLDMDAQGSWRTSILKSVYVHIAQTFVSHIDDMYMAICTPVNPGEEFVLTDNCYNVLEGRTTSYYDESLDKHITMGSCFHRFAPISPRLMLVLRANHLPGPNGNANPWGMEYPWFPRRPMSDPLYGGLSESILDDLPIRRATANYTRCPDGILWDTADGSGVFAMDDDSCFMIFKIPTRHVRKMNGLLIDDAFHGSRIVFNQKDAFLDLMEWYLTEPCEVGRNSMDEHAATQLAYIKGLSQFMLREGRAVAPEWTFWPSENRDLRQMEVEELAGERFLGEIMHGESDAGFGYGVTYQRLGGTEEKFEEDTMLSRTMFDTWATCVDLDWGSPEYERLRTKKLEWLLEGYLRQSCARFWMFLKRMRFAHSFQTSPSRDPEAIHDISFFEEGCRGSEDMFADYYPVIQGRELNEAMYKDFNKSMDLIRGPGRGMESMGHFSLSGDPSWRIPTPMPIERWPWNEERIIDEDVDEALLASLVDAVNRKASTNRHRRNQQSDESEVEDFDMRGLKKAAQSWLLHNKRTEAPTKAVEVLRPDDDKETQEMPDALRKAAPTWLLDKEDNETPTNKFEGLWPDNATGTRKASATGEKASPEQPQNRTHRGPPPGYPNRPKQGEAGVTVLPPALEAIMFFGGYAYFIMLASLTFLLLGASTYLLSSLFHFTAWIVQGLAWLLAVCSSGFFYFAKCFGYLALDVGLLLGLYCSCFLN